MDFAFTDEQLMIAETAQSFFADNATSERTRKAMASDGLDRETWQSFCQELGLSGLLIADEFGGSNLGMVEFANIAEAAGTQIAAIPLLGQTMVGQAIAAGGTQEQKSHWLPKLAAGEIVATAGGSADLQADNNRLSGKIGLIPHGNIAEIFILSDGSNAWIVESGADGFFVETPTTMDQTRPLATLILEGVDGEPLGDSDAAMEAGKTAGWICLAAEALGGAQACLDRTVAYSKERVQFGRAIGSFQAYKHRAADMMIEIEQARSAVYWAACAVDEGSDDAKLAIHAAKAFSADTFFKCAGDMIQLHGGIGFTWEHDAHIFFKRARSIQTMMLDGNWHRERIATMLLGEAA
ncbi:MAG: acyl-CoA dehydrogenase family protein [Parasphingorhabdus sp.]|uniref:acyl-CoA dehydrogenase family protein n=1 Tax=Parasphingorhabdus sp. TaxID=2709688 RepID=UPI0032657A8C